VKHTLKERYYIRYTDDFVIVHHDASHLAEIKNKIEAFLAERLKLSLHPDKVEIRKYSQGIDFLGYVTLPHARVLRTRTKRRIKRKLHKKLLNLQRANITEQSFLQTFGSYMGVLEHADTHELGEAIRQEIWEFMKGGEDGEANKKRGDRSGPL
jgi:RNA-directed DNA polymerase